VTKKLAENEKSVPKKLVRRRGREKLRKRKSV
jgi:hypothetical protein